MVMAKAAMVWGGGQRNALPKLLVSRLMALSMLPSTTWMRFLRDPLEGGLPELASNSTDRLLAVIGVDTRVQ